MPYIKKELRKKFDKQIQDVVDELIECPEEELEGCVNYVVSKIIASSIGQGNWRYYKINRVMGVLESVKQEFYRRVAAPYELAAAVKNGDIYDD